MAGTSRVKTRKSTFSISDAIRRILKRAMLEQAPVAGTKLPDESSGGRPADGFRISKAGTYAFACDRAGDLAGAA
ncbi:hypothetical protein DEM27_26840 [Metarhizobium album]|uniref:Uncharacterized protein n=1 Tax=Metarhizobium album TaxID=2182425 RepID=A0A2U2DJ13_9HYPH|nr:hypothetical protein [Rhizobium album]PWE53282.1 hypothetical protein DEM27_26840 [Rhizobium album]